MTYRPLGILAVALCWVVADEAAPAEAAGCAPGNLNCWLELHAAACSGTASTLETCLVFLQRLETARRVSYSTGVALLLGKTLRDLARRDLSPLVKERYLERARDAYREVVDNEPFNAAGYLGLADAAERGEPRVGWLRSAVQAEFQPAHMELLSDALLEVGGHEADLEAARVLEDAYTYESANGEKWRYAAAAWQRHTVALERHPAATSARALDNVVVRLTEDIDYAVLQRMLREPESFLQHLAGAFATMCEKSIAVIVELDECMTGLELAVGTAERSPSRGTRRVLAEAVLVGMRTIAGEGLPPTSEAQRRFPDWIDRLLMTRLEAVEVAADLLEARADYTALLPDRADFLLAGIELLPNRGDLRIKLGETYVSLQAWPEALEQLRVARYFLPAEEHERIDKLVETADQGYQARFWPSDRAE